MLNLKSSIRDIPGVGEATFAKFKKLNINTCEELLWHLPYRYEDYSHLIPINKIPTNTKVTIEGKVQLIQSRRSFKRRLSITEALITDGTGTVKCIWFNQPYLAKQIKVGQHVLLAGILKKTNYGLQLDNPTYESNLTENIHTARLVPNYHLTAGLTSRNLRQLINKVLPLLNNHQDWLPTDIKKKYSLIDIGASLKQVHFPDKITDIQLARRRLAFDELLLLRLSALAAKKDYASKPAPKVLFSPRSKDFVTALPWTLTEDQRKTAWQIIKDLGGDKPMNRLLQGDVGSGKTVVAGIGALNVIEAGFMVALLAPTEILARQHFETLKKLFRNFPITIGLFTRSQNEINQDEKLTKKQIIDMVNDKKINFVVGTHALLTEQIKISNLGLLIIDEQHRFGVEQRNWFLKQSNITPHLLSLSATPIPRSLALTIYGDLDISLIKELPKGRKKIITKIINDSTRTSAYTLIRQEIAAGHKVFIICPLIEESDTTGIKSVAQEKNNLEKNIFPEITIGGLHGQMSGKEKIQALADFASGKTPVLVSTTVIEVGIDIPDATVIMIEDAQTFGLAQLHQLRGRVGRSELQCYCLLMANDQTVENQRLKALVKFTNGFDLAEQDLEMRGPGDLLGLNQSGWLPLKVANLGKTELLEMVRAAADTIQKNYPNFLEESIVKDKLRDIFFHPE